MTTQQLEFFATDDALAQLESALQAAQHPAQRLPALVALAWQLRQRDGDRALALAEQAQDLLLAQPDGWSAGQTGGLAEASRSSYLGRLDLLRAEIQHLIGDMAAAEVLLARAVSVFENSTDTLGLGDAQWLEQMLWLGLGEPARAHVCNQAAQAHYRAAGDGVRLEAALACSLFHAAFSDGEQVRLGLERDFPEQAAARHAAVDSWLLAARALVNGMAGDSGAAARLFLQAYAKAEASGQLSLACVLAFNASNGFTDLNDLNLGLEWAERGLNLARVRRWAARVGRGLEVSGNLLRLLGRYPEAQAMLEEALAIAKTTSKASSFLALVQGSLAALAVDICDGDAALSWAQECESTARTLGLREQLVQALGVQTQALAQLNRPEQAMQTIDRALALAQEAGNPLWRLEVLRILAGLHRQHVLPPPPGVAADSVVLHYLQEALTLARGLQDFVLPVALLEEAAAAYAQAGDGQQAYRLALEAGGARERIHSQQASNRAVALQVRHETESLRHEAEQLRRLSRVETERAEGLQQAAATLEALGLIGREITASLNADAIFATLLRHANSLLDLYSLSAYALEADGQHLASIFAVEDGRRLPGMRYSIDDPRSFSARCAREREEFLIDIEDSTPLPALIAGTRETRSLLFAPLLVGGRLLGVMSIQSERVKAYAERERSIFRSLCAYSAIALDNAYAYAEAQAARAEANRALHDLRQTQAQLIQSEKMVSLGQLVANVAHEINTPIGAIKSSGATIVESLSDTLAGLPPLLQTLDATSQALVGALIEQASRVSPLLSSREERVIVKGLAAELAQSGLEDGWALATLLAQMGLTTIPADTVVLLRHPQRERILRAVQSVSTVVRSAANINTAVERVAKIVFALKSFSRVDKSGEMRPTDLAESIETVLTIYQNQIKQGCDVIRRYEEDLPLLPCLPDELNQIWTNLIHNALQAMQHQGVLTITIRRDGSAELLVSVGDSGCGIPEAIRGRIFDPFFTTKPVGEGSGLGLDIVKKIVDKHQGRIEVASEVGVGTTFSVYLPLDIKPAGLGLVAGGELNNSSNIQG
ncbi:ATP-binding protein [Roseateles albus]|uniref:histidine kinase n=1 Tax=Roseateles albus TaxID=2987525 RepID=A0ABT5KCQ9_9BURK|nr:ATP-binding protein [Roseateles albus]MDC8771239.1 ATP-binding protein [Roseateles albus]